MITILHGDNIKESRDKLTELTSSLKSKDVSLTWISGESISKQELESSLLTNSLFSEDALIIENLLSRIKSKAKEECIDLISSYKGDKEIILWERKGVTKTLLNKFKKKEVKEYKIPITIFKCISGISPGNKKTNVSLFKDALKTAESGFLFAMLSRQVSKLIVAKTSPDNLQGAPWQKAQVHKQADKWDIEDLTSSHNKLLAIDESIKTGQSSLDLTTQLDLFALEL